MSLGSIIRQRREQLKLTQDQLAAQVGISKPYISNIETDKVRNPPSDAILRALERGLDFPAGQLTRIAHLARTPIDVRQEHELLEAEVQKLREVLKQLLADLPAKGSLEADMKELARDLPGRRVGLSAGVLVPVVNKPGADYPLRFTDLEYPARVAEEYVRCPDVHDPRAFAVRVIGDAMEPKYRQGDVVVFSPAVSPRGGDDCFVRFAGDGKTTFSRFYRDDPETVRLQPLNNKYAGQTYHNDDVAGLWPAVYRFERLREQ